MKISRMLFLSAVCGALCLGSSAQADLIGSWQFEEGAGDTAADSSPSNVPGQITNAETGGLGANGSVWVNDPERGSVISFNGLIEGAYVRAGSLPTMTLDNDFTWAFWAHNLEATQPNNIVVGNRKDGASPEAEFDPRQFTKFTPTQFEFHTNGVGDGNVNYDDMAVGQWVHHAVVKEGAMLTYYKNGVVGNTHTLLAPQFEPMPLFFGGDSEAVVNGNDNENWHGLLDDVQIYDNALSAAEVGDLAGIPEPSAFCLLVAGSTCLLGAVRRRNPIV